MRHNWQELGVDERVLFSFVQRLRIETMYVIQDIPFPKLLEFRSPVDSLFTTWASSMLGAGIVAVTRRLRQGVVRLKIDHRSH